MSTNTTQKSLVGTIAKNSLTGYLRFAISIGVMLLLTPFIIKGIGTDEYGLWVLIFSVLGFFGLLDFGLGTGAVKYTAECHGAADIDRRNKIISSLMVVYLGLAALAAVVLYGMSLYFAEWFRIDASQADKIKPLILILAVRTTILALPLSLFRSLLFGYQKIWVINAIQAGSMLLFGLGVYVIIGNGYGIIGLALVSLAAMLCEYLAYLIFAYRMIPSLKISLKLWDPKLLKEVSSFSFYSFLVSIAALILLRTDPIIIQMFLSLSAVAVYAVAMKVAEQIYLLVKQFVSVLTPLIANLHAQKDTNSIRHILISGTKLALVPAVIIALWVIFLGREGLVFWVGSEFEGATSILIILTLSMVASVPQLTSSTVLAMSGHHKFTARAAIASAGLNAIISLLLVRSLGITGVALGTLITTVLIDIFVIVPKACREYQITLSDYFTGSILPLIWPASAMTLLMMFIKWMQWPESIILLAVKAIMGAVLFILCFWYLSLDRNERSHFLSCLPKKLTRRVTKPLTSQA